MTIAGLVITFLGFLIAVFSVGMTADTTMRLVIVLVGIAMSLATHTRIHGPLPNVPPHQLIEEVERSGLRGRGGADFPTARKLRAVAGRRRVGAVIVNGSETEPASAKDRLLLSRA